jgi:hypothetical protein
MRLSRGGMRGGNPGREGTGIEFSYAHGRHGTLRAAVHTNIVFVARGSSNRLNINTYYSRCLRTGNGFAFLL